MSASEANLDQELEQIADELYGLRPEEFASARDARIREARKDGKAALAKELAKLRKPTLSAWLVNLLWRDQRDVMEQLFDLSQELSRAQAEAAGPALRELTAQRRQLETALMQRAATLGKQAGASVTDSVAREAQETLSAALAQPEVAEEVRSGRLVKPASYSGFGVLPGTRPAAPAKPAKPAVEHKEPIDIQAAQRAREREKAERRVQEARAAVDAAAGTVSEQSRKAESARQRETDLRARLEQAREQLKRMESEVEAAGHEAATAEHAREQAENAQRAAQQELEQALNGLAQ
jgi:hypothetical protein